MDASSLSIEVVERSATHWRWCGRVGAVVPSEPELTVQVRLAVRVREPVALQLKQPLAGLVDSSLGVDEVSVVTAHEELPKALEHDDLDGRAGCAYASRSTSSRLSARVCSLADDTSTFVKQDDRPSTARMTGPTGLLRWPYSLTLPTLQYQGNFRPMEDSSTPPGKKHFFISFGLSFVD
jgi:hypothetical protein